MTRFIPLTITFPWQLSALGSGLLNYKRAIDWNETDNLGHSPAHYIAMNGSVERLKWALTQDKDALTRVNGHFQTVVHLAARLINPDILEWILTQDKDALTRTDCTGRCLAHHLAESGNIVTLSWILKQDPHVLTRKTHNGSNFAHCAVRSGHLDTLEWILRQDKDVLNVRDNDGLTPVFYATRFDRTAMLKLILTKDKYALTRPFPYNNEYNTRGAYPLVFRAAMQGNYEILEYLFSKYPVIAKEALLERVYKDTHVKYYTILRSEREIDASLVEEVRSNLYAVISKVLAEATNRIASGMPEEGDVLLLSTLKGKWLAFLITNKNFNAQDLLAKLSSLPAKLQSIIQPALPTLMINGFVFTSGEVTKGELRNLIALLPAIDKKLKPSLGQLLTMLCQEGDGPLSPEETGCLDVITKEYVLNKEYVRDPGTYTLPELVVRKLTDSSTLRAFNKTPIVDFSDYMQHYIKEYLNYAKIILGQTEAQAKFIEPASQFIETIFRRGMYHYGDQSRRPDSIYERPCRNSPDDIEKYLKDVLGYESKKPVPEIEALITELKSKSAEISFASFWNQGSIQSQISALTELKQVWEAALERKEKPSPETVLLIKEKYPQKTWDGFKQETRDLFDKVEEAIPTLSIKQ